MFETLKRLYVEGKLTGDGLASALDKRWITQEQLEEISAMEVG